MKPNRSREELLELAFSEIPSAVGSHTLRPLSASSFALLGRLENPMLVGKKAPSPQDATTGQTEMFDAVIEYIWVHAEDIDIIVSIKGRQDLQKHETAIRKLGFEITMGQAMLFLERYKEAANRMSASLAETEDDETPGKSGVSPPPGSLPSFSFVEAPEIQHESDTFSGSCQSNELSPISMLPTLPTAQPAAGPAQTSTTADTTEI